MCGIIGYIGNKPAADILMNGLKRLEYRGYDSAGIALFNESFYLKKRAGKIALLEEKIEYDTLNEYTLGIAHTRWATHGEPNQINAHPHTDCKNEIAIAHNGIIENYMAIKKMLISKGHELISDTDTEVIAHLIEYHYERNSLLDSVIKAISNLEGTFGLVVISRREPDKIIAARMGSPLILGIGDEEMIIASEASAIIEHTQKVIYFEDNEIVQISKDKYKSYDQNNKRLTKQIEEIDLDLSSIEKQGYEHFMLKEIFEQPDSVTNSFRGRLLEETGDIRLDGLNLSNEELSNIERIIFIACGTSWHAALIGEYLIEEYARIPVEVEYASEFRYRRPILKKNQLIIVISQSGETADTLAALREAKSQGIKVLGITNVVGSSIPRETDGGAYIHAGPEIGVASTKAFTSQVSVLIQLTIMLARRTQWSAEKTKEIISRFKKIPEDISTILEKDNLIREIAEQYKDTRNFLYLGRGVQFPVALEGALKLKEISYVHAEGYPAAEMKHGPIALIDEHMPVVFIAPRDEVYKKVINSMEEVKARKGRIIAIANEGDEEIKNYSEHVIYIPSVRKMFSPLITVVPLQLLAYHIAVLRGCDVDQPRNLAKSVTVE